MVTKYHFSQFAITTENVVFLGNNTDEDSEDSEDEDESSQQEEEPQKKVCIFNLTAINWNILNFLIYFLEMSPTSLTGFFEGKMHGVHPQNGIPDFSLHFPKELSYG